MSEATLEVVVPDGLIEALAYRLEERVQAKKWFTTVDLADHLGVTPRYVRGFSERGCPNHRVGKKSLWNIEEVSVWLAAR